jgi:hypothetical protein
MEEFVVKRTLLYLSLAIFIAVLGLSWFTHGTGVIRNDTSRNIYIPTELTMPLQVMAAYNGRDIATGQASPDRSRRASTRTG